MRDPIAVILLIAGAAVATAAHGQVIDDFASYADRAALQEVWSFADLDTTTPNHAQGTQSLRRQGDDFEPNSGLFESGDLSAWSASVP
jgi:hypothetical protein